MNRGKPVSPPASPPASPCASPTPTLPTAEDWLARIAALDATQPPPTPPRLRTPRKAKRRRAVTVVAMARAAGTAGHRPGRGGAVDVGQVAVTRQQRKEPSSVKPTEPGLLYTLTSWRSPHIVCMLTYA